jgi:hypothetical protein
MSIVVYEKKMFQYYLSDLFNVSLSVENKPMKSIKNCDQHIPEDVRMAVEQARSSLLLAKSHLF